MDTEDLIYAAGFLDGEGCFTVTNRRYVRTKVLCENTYRPIVEWLHQKFGGRVVYDIKGKKPNHRATHRWELSDGHAAAFAARIAPYLREKADQALLLIAIHQTKGRTIGRHVDPEQMAERHRLAAIMKAAKGRL
jgi:hypothetical protein